MAARVRISPWHLAGRGPWLQVPCTYLDIFGMSTSMVINSLVVISGGVILYGGTTYAVYSYVSAHKLPTAPATSDASAPASAPGSGSGPCQCAFDVIAGQYDTAVGSEEWSMGYPLLRKWVLNHASGDVLEISAGTGRNLPHYSMGALRRLTICDLSEPMLQVGSRAHPLMLQVGSRAHPLMNPDVSPP